LLLLLAPHPMSLLIAPCFFFIHLMRKPTCLRPISRPQHWQEREILTEAPQWRWGWHHIYQWAESGIQ
jgi:hypothetical protein